MKLKCSVDGCLFSLDLPASQDEKEKLVLVVNAFKRHLLTHTVGDLFAAVYRLAVFQIPEFQLQKEGVKAL
jgi:hypothetical protein